MKNYKDKAFSLVEISIVLVIIGLLAAGVTVGHKLIDQAREKSIIQKAESYRTAVAQFKLTYNTLPGDMKDASSYWSACTDESGNTCNGDNDGRIESTGDVSKEGYRAWQHLRLAKIIKGNFTGLGTSSVIGTNVPRTSFNGLCFNFHYWGANGSRNGVALGGINDTCTVQAVTAQTAYNIDLKADDGDGFKGEINSNIAPCAPLGVYNLDATGTPCYMHFSTIN